jgi:hypothetical protein
VEGHKAILPKLRAPNEEDAAVKVHVAAIQASDFTGAQAGARDQADRGVQRLAT